MDKSKCSNAGQTHNISTEIITLQMPSLYTV